MNKRELAIIGAGPAGLTAGIYAARASMDTILLERGIPGGLVIMTDFIENYPCFGEGISGPELMEQMEKQARHFGLDILTASVEEIGILDQGFSIKTKQGEIVTEAIIVASGMMPQLLGVKGEKELLGRGVSYCATCDGAFFRGKTIAVVGGGDAAIEEALFLTRFAEKVYVIHRRGELRATKILQHRAFENPKIVFVWHSVVDEIIGIKTVESVTVRDVRDNSTSAINVNGVFIYVGARPNNSLVKDLVKVNDRGFIITDEEMMTSQQGIFAAGDVRQKLLRQVVTAVADGAIAAFAAEKYLAEKRRLFKGK